jgi:hypothetical protein
MTIDEAIKLLEENIDHTIQPYDRELADAIGLGIEALKRIKDLRAYNVDAGQRIGTPLSGETEEVDHAPKS